jgi:5-methylthioadenosine/S-adenosylhomocysteine deaminase
VKDGAVLVRDGGLSAVGAFAELEREHPDEPVRDLGQAALLPGFVNAHSHLEISGLRWAMAGLLFAEWIPRLIELRMSALEPEDDEISSRLGAVEMLRAGVTSLGDCTSSGAPRAAMAEAGLRGVVFQEAFAPQEDRIEPALTLFRRRLRAAADEDESRVRTGLSPHSPYASFPALLRGTAELAAESGRPISIHLAESEAERAYLRDGSGPIARNRPAGPMASGLSPVEHLEREGWLTLGSPVQLVHLCTASESELDILAERARHPNAPVLAACPRSNLRLGNGAPDLAGWTARELPFSVATDGAPSTGACDLFAELRLAARLLELAGRPAGPRELLLRATLAGARALGLQDEVGTLEPGKRADLTAVSLAGARFEPEGDPEAAVLESASPADVVFTMVDGEALFENGALTRLDEERIRDQARERAARLARALD